jgi:hypothetical protein
MELATSGAACPMWWLNNGHHCPNSAVNTSNAPLADVDNEFLAYRSTLGFFIDHDTFLLVAIFCVPLAI